MRALLVFCLVVFSPAFELFSCQDGVEITYPVPQNQIECEIDQLLSDAELCLFTGDLQEALFKIERADALNQLVSNKNSRRLRVLFDKAVAITCLEGPSENSGKGFYLLESHLAETKCKPSEEEKPNLFDENGHWPIFAPDVMPMEECIEAVENTIVVAMIAAGKLPVNAACAMAIEGAIYLLGQQAKGCCTERGFFKTCIQPLTDAWKRMDVLKLPPDPLLD